VFCSTACESFPSSQHRTVQFIIFM
jgi:hypothetical protein